MHSGREGGREGISGQTETHEPVAEELSAVMTTDTGRLAAVRGQTKAIFGAVYPRFSPGLSETLVGTLGRSAAGSSLGFVHAVCAWCPLGGVKRLFTDTAPAHPSHTHLA